MILDCCLYHLSILQYFFYQMTFPLNFTFSEFFVISPITYGLYFFGKNKSQQDYIINNTRSGGVTINDTMFHLLQSRLPFGGVGHSGYGYYHGYEGFLNFSNLRAIYYQTYSDSILSLIRPPRGKLFNLLSKLMKRLG